MARFRYRLQSVLNIKEQMETQAKQEFASAKMTLEEEIQKQNEIAAELRFHEQEAVRLRNGVLDFGEIELNAFAIEQVKAKLAQQTAAVEKARRILERARDHMAEAVMERKTHERLREKAFDEFLAEEGRAEGKQIDELTSYTYGQKET